MITNTFSSMTSVALDHVNRIQRKIPLLPNSIKEKTTACFKKFQTWIEKGDEKLHAAFHRPNFGQNRTLLVNVITAVACFKLSLQISMISLIGGILLGLLNDKGTISKFSPARNQQPHFNVHALAINAIAFAAAVDVLKQSTHPLFIMLPMATYGFHLGRAMKNVQWHSLFHFDFQGCC